MRALIAGYDTHVAKPIETNGAHGVASLVGRLLASRVVGQACQSNRR